MSIYGLLGVLLIAAALVVAWRRSRAGQRPLEAAPLASPSSSASLLATPDGDAWCEALCRLGWTEVWCLDDTLRLAAVSLAAWERLQGSGGASAGALTALHLVDLAPADGSAALLALAATVRRGKPAITVESGGLGSTDEASVRRLEEGVLSLMAQLRMLEAPSVRVEKPLWIDRAQVVTSPATGVWHPVVDQKDNVPTGALLGRITDPFGNVTQEVRAPFAGEVLYVVATPPVSAGEPLAFVGHVTEAEPQP